jgi:hypothetical protein
MQKQSSATKFVLLCYTIVQCNNSNNTCFDVRCSPAYICYCLAASMHRSQPNAVRIIDVRTAGEYQAGHIQGALNASFLPPWDWPSRQVSSIMPGLRCIRSRPMNRHHGQLSRVDDLICWGFLAASQGEVAAADSMMPTAKWVAPQLADACCKGGWTCLMF